MSGKRQKQIRRAIKGVVNKEWRGLYEHVKKMSLWLRLRMAWIIITKSKGEL